MVLDLSIARLRQIVANIKQRKREELDQRAFFVEWQTKTLAGFIAATTGREGAGLQKEAAKIDLLGLLQESLGAKKSESGSSMPEVIRGGTDTGGKEAPGAAEDELPDFVKNGSAVAMRRNQSGSAEALLGGFR